MSQTLHIFKKDVRHLYPEILLTLSLTIAFALIEGLPRDTIVMLFGGLLRFLLPVTWLILIARLVQDESLVGDNQFWITRPYKRSALLAAKLLFLVAFIFLPLLLAQCYLLAHANLHIAAALPDLLLNLLAIIALFFLPLTVLAAITSSLPRFLIALTSTALYVGALVFFGAYFFGRRMEAPYIRSLAIVLLLILPASALLLQYARRNIRLAAILFIAAPTLVFLIYLLPAGLAIDHLYPTWNSSTAPKLLFDRDPLRQQPTFGNSRASVYTFNGHVFLNLPLQIEGLSDLHLATKGITVSIDSPQGVHWSAPWYTFNAEFDSQYNRPNLQVVLPLSIFNRIRDSPVNLHISLALLKVQMELTQTVIPTDESFAAPGRGVCSIGDNHDLAPTCSYALREPNHILTAADVYPNRCGSDVAPLGRVKGRLGDLFDNSLTLGLNPVITLPLLSAGSNNGRPLISGNFLCPQKPIFFTPNQIVGKAQLHLDQDAIILAPYATINNRGQNARTH